MLPLVTASCFLSVILSFTERSFYFLYLLFCEMWRCLLHFRKLLLRANLARCGLWQEGVPVSTSAHQLAQCFYGPVEYSVNFVSNGPLFLSCCWPCADRVGQVSVHMEPPKLLVGNTSQALASGSVLRGAHHAAWLPSCCPSPPLPDLGQVGSSLPHSSCQPAL